MSQAHDPRHFVMVTPFRGRLEAHRAGILVAASCRALIVSETGLQDRFYIPPQDVMVVLEPTSRRSTCPFKGGARYWTLRTPSTVADNIAWSYDKPTPLAQPIRDFISFYTDRITLTATAGE
jgi:uncharacterized protein (DUF427 family)